MHEVPALAFTAVMVAWGVSEAALGLFKRSGSKRNARYDAGTFRLLWVTIVLSLFTGIWIGKAGYGRVPQLHPWAEWFGLTLGVLGMVLRWTAILTLRRFFTVDVAILDGHRVIRHGVYRWVRHPSYSGVLLSLLGLGLYLESWIGALLITVPTTYALMRRIQMEEKALVEALGQDYLDYRATTARLLPFVY